MKMSAESLTQWDLLQQDIRLAVRAFRRAPGLALTVVFVSMIGIGATTIAFSIADHVLLKPLPFRQSERLVKLWQVPGRGRLEASPGNFRDWKARASSFESVAAFATTAANLVGANEPLRLEGAMVSGDLFGVLGVPPMAGRGIAFEDDREAAPSVVVISERLWIERFGAGGAVLGRTVTLNDVSREIIGVMPRTFEFPSRASDFWIPFQFAPADYVYGTQNPYLQTIARLKPGASRESARAEMQQIARDIARVVPRVSADIGVDVIDLRDEVAPQSRLLIRWLVAAAVCLLLIACTNLANLLLTRGVAQQKELAIRTALGATRRRLMRQMLTESLVLSALGGVAGVALAVVGMPTVASLVPAVLPIGQTPQLDGRLLLAAAVATIASAMSFGLLPALRAGRLADASVLRVGAWTDSGPTSGRLRATFVVAQVAAAIVLLVSSGLLLRAMLRVQEVDPGFQAEGVLSLRTALSPLKYGNVARRHAFFKQVIDEVQALPGVSRAAYISGLPLVMRASVWAVSIPELGELPRDKRTASLRFVTPGLFAALRIPLIAGRDVSEADTQTSLPVAVVSEQFAHRYWPGQDALGRGFKVQGRDRTIVGVVGEVRVRGLEQESEPQIYLPSQQVNDGQLPAYIPRDLVVKSSVSPAALVPSIRAIIARVDPEQPVSDVRPLTDVVVGETATRRVQVQVLGAFAIIAFLLAGIGLHGMLSYHVTQREREFRIRLALGAERASILRMVMRSALTLTVVGVVIGTAFALGVGRLLQSLLVGISSTDALTFGAAVALTVVMTLVGSVVPALRATRLNPFELTHSE